MVTSVDSSAAVWTQVNSCYETKASVAIKADKSTSSKTLVTIPKDTYIYVIRINGSWGKTAYNGQTGWIYLSSSSVTRKNAPPETTTEVVKRLDAIQRFHAQGDIWKGSTEDSSAGGYRTNSGSLDGTEECFGFAREVWRALYGSEMVDAYKANKKYELGSKAASKLMTLKGQLITWKYNVNDVKNLLLKAKPGDIIQACTSSATVGNHTMIVDRVTEDGIWIYDANADPDVKNKIMNRFLTWEQFFKYKPSGISLYGYTNYPSSDIPFIVGGNISVLNTSGASSSSFYLGDRLTFSASIRNATSVKFYIYDKATNQSLRADGYTAKDNKVNVVFSEFTGKTKTYYVKYVAKNEAYTYTSNSVEFTIHEPDISLTGSKYTMYPGDTITLSANKIPNTASSTITWTSSNLGVATVNASTGAVTAKGVGTTTITASLKYKGTGGGYIYTTATASITVKERVFTITFNGNSGTPSASSIQVTNNGTYGSLPTATRTGYKFDGWYTAASGGTKITASSKVSLTSNQTLYAHWSALSYTVTFNANGSTNAAGNKPTLLTTSKSVKYASTYGTLPTPTWAGYTFLGWYTSKTGGTKIVSTTKVSITSGVTLYARWQANTYKATFNANGGSVSTASKNVVYLAKYGTLPTPTRTGYTFAGWYTAASGGSKVDSSTLYLTASNVTLYAHWSAKTYTVKFDANGGSVSTASKTVTYNSKYGTMPVPNYKGYAFLGWYTSKEGGTKVTSASVAKMTSTVTLYAHWQPGSYTVSFNANGGTSETDSKSVFYLSEYGELPIPSRDGYTFVGWFTSATGGTQIYATSSVQVTDHQILYARWNVNTYTITFDTQSDESAFEGIKVTFDTAVGGLPVPFKTGYAFTGWYTALENGTQIFSDTVYKTGSDIMLYATWTPVEYEIIFDINGGDGENISKKVFFDDIYGELPVPSKLGYEFRGWVTSKDISDSDALVYVSHDTVMKTPGTVTVYAYWIPKQINITFDANGGSINDAGGNATDGTLTDRYIYDAKYNILPIATRPGYNFIAWKTESDEVITKDSIVKLAEDSVLVAVWKAKEYEITLDTNGGVFIDADTSLKINVVYDSTYPNLPTPTRQGYRFIGWKTVNNNHAFTGAAVKILSNQSFVAEWVPVKSYVLFNAGLGTVEIDSKSVVFDAQYGDLPIPTREGYTFKGWVLASGMEVDASTIVADYTTHTLTAVWEVNVYNVNFDSLDADITIDSIRVAYGKEYGMLSSPSRIGYRFICWEDAAGKVVNAGDIALITSDITLTAVWTPISAELSFDSNGAQYVVPPMVVIYDSTFGTLPYIERAGYIFEGWYYGEQKIMPDDEVFFTEGITLKAHWTAMSFEVIFDHDGGVCAVDKAEFTSDKLYASLPVITKKGHLFLGWYGPDGEQITDKTAVIPVDELVFTAKWAPMVFDVKFSIDGVIDESLTRTIEYNTEYGSLPEHHSFGYEFLGWLDEDGNEVNPNTVFTLTDDIVLTADIKMNSFNITFYADGGKPEYSHMTVYYKDTFGKLPETVKMGYMFAGWYTRDGVQVTEDTQMLFTSNTTLFARWIKIEANTAAALDNNDTLLTGCGIAAVVDGLALAVGFALKKRKKFKK